MAEEEKTILDKAKELAVDIKDKVTDLVSDNEDKITGAIDRTGEFVDDKTKGKNTEKIDKGVDSAKSAVAKIADKSPKADGPTPPTEPVVDTEPEGSPTDPIPDA
jgi:hypothetical protein